jgi:repressor LexA
MRDSKAEQNKSIRLSITNFWYKNKRMPSMSELAKVAGYKSKESAFRLSERLIEEGFLAKDSTGRIYLRSIGKIKLLGHVEAGFPLPADERLLKNISLDEWLIRNRTDSFMLSVSGDSM